MIVLVVVLVVVVVALVVAIVRLRSQADDLTALAGERAAARDQARTEAATARTRADAAEAQRDAALERAARARRDAAEVARRLQEEVAARAGAEAEAADAQRQAQEARTALEEAAERSAGGGSGDDAAFLWAVARSQVERLWQVSVAAVPGAPSPLDGTDDPLAAAATIVIDAAREEAGAPVELTWEGGPPMEAPTALVALALLQELVAAVAKDAESADVVVQVDEQAVVITLDAVGIDGLAERVAPGFASGPDRWCVARR